MKKLIITIAVVAAIPIGYWLISPLFIEKRVDERLEDIFKSSEPKTDMNEASREPEIISSGSFVGLAAHNAEGTAKLLKIGDEYFVRFESDFRVTNGPDLFVYFGKDGKYVAEARLDALKGNAGAQNYRVPTNLNPADYNEVWVWCRAFSVPFGKAELR